MTDNILYYGDNLDVLRQHIKDETVDLIYLDPPFNSNANYNVLFKEKDGTQSEAQIQAFGDTWHWDQAAATAYEEIVEKGGKVSEALQAFRILVGQNDMLAYLTMMSSRLVELHRVLKATGSLYLHCDPTASHYLKIILDTIFGIGNFKNEIVWKRTSAHSDTIQGNVVHMGRVHDIILFYTKSDEEVRNQIYLPYSENYIEKFYKYKDPDGRRFRLGDITGPGGAAKGNPQYEFLGVTRYWRYSRDRMNELYKQGRIVQLKGRTGSSI